MISKIRLIFDNKDKKEIDNNVNVPLNFFLYVSNGKARKKVYFERSMNKDHFICSVDTATDEVIVDIIATSKEIGMYYDALLLHNLNIYDPSWALRGGPVPQYIPGKDILFKEIIVYEHYDLESKGYRIAHRITKFIGLNSLTDRLKMNRPVNVTIVLKYDRHTYSELLRQAMQSKGGLAKEIKSFSFNSDKKGYTTINFDKCEGSLTETPYEISGVIDDYELVLNAHAYMSSNIYKEIMYDQHDLTIVNQFIEIGVSPTDTSELGFLLNQYTKIDFKLMSDLEVRYLFGKGDLL